MKNIENIDYAHKLMENILYFLLNIARPHRMFHGAIMTMWKKKASLSLGAFIFVSDDPLCFYQAYKNEITEEEMFSRFAVHEYGHTIQSLIWGPLYLVTVGISSVSWAMIPFFWKMRERKQLSYFSVYPEIMANFWGEKVTGKISPGQIV